MNKIIGNIVIWLRATPLLFLTAATWADTPHANFALDTRIDPVTHKLEIQADIVLPEIYAGKTLEFLLTDAVEITSAQPAVQRLPFDINEDDNKGFTGINGSSVELTDSGHIARYQVQLPANSTTLHIAYQGTINFALGDEKEQYTRGFRSTAGIIGEEGIYLAGSSLWYPYFSNDLVNFTLSTNVPAGWHLISQGNGTSRDEQGMAHWDSGGAVDEIYLVGGPLIQYSEPAGAVSAEVYLHEPDDALAKKYLTATAQYLEMYRNLIGPYPYGKFALVENFWETGYGMPTFTLLGPQIIRFPFILTSSYPHEILHNWWGNSVFVDYESGNWCEGLTAYMADHLIQEQYGRGAPYRRDTLKKYRDFVKEDRDFPLTEFRSRHSAATEAIGYGKTLMGFHMLRLQIGDELFKQGLARFYRNNRGRQASFADIRTDLEAVSNQDFGTFFEQWVEWTGAANLVVRDVRVRQSAGEYTVNGNLIQTQDGQAYQLTVPVNITTVNGLETSTINLSDKSTAFEITTTAEPLLLEVDPEFDLFRLLDPRETAPSIGQIFGEPEIIAVLPTRGDAELLAGYRQLAEGWQSDSHSITIVSDTDIDKIPATKAVWLFGKENRLARTLFGSDPSLALTETAVIPQGQEIPLQDHSAVLVKRHPDNASKAIGWIIVDPSEALPGLGGKLPHYGKYSYLGFAGEEPANRVKGEWVATDSPLRVDLRADDLQGNVAVQGAVPPPRKALAEIPPVFSRERLLEHIQYLASDELEGRGLGTPGLAKAADYIADQFKAAGLAPAGDDDGYRQVFPVAEGEDGKPHDVANIVGIIPGRNPAYAGQAVLVTAHYDHLGHGWPDARAEDKGKIYNGADDNASGVAIMIELAKLFVAEAAPERSIVFIAFTGEEAGLLGSRYYAEHPAPGALDGIIGVVNMDTVGQLGAQNISVFGAGSASEWPHVFRGIGFTAGIGSTSITGHFASSDHQAFIDKGVPAVQVSSGANLDYHRPSDTVDKIDSAGLIKVAMFVKETVTYLTGRPEMLTITIDGTQATPKPAESGTAGKRRASVGTVPDFAFQGPGVLVSAVVPGSPAVAAGIVAGDVLISLAGTTIENLQSYTDVLKSLSPGDTVAGVVQRDGESIDIEVTVTAR
ncbi:MAG: M20/M25/M40 family metallo-hydrolase [Gammaproteobacteria bacterium]|jgi:hypothetical protein|nr:hypothetical protein [Chromatiales bacterium]MDP6675112.1 M20/M25/M40 family metallo-hydrolase [Gammaproteobacteria bacterium]